MLLIDCLPSPICPRELSACLRFKCYAGFRNVCIMLESSDLKGSFCECNLSARLNCVGYVVMLYGTPVRYVSIPVTA